MKKREKILEIYRRVNKFAVDNAIVFLLAGTFVVSMWSSEARAEDMTEKQMYMKDCIIPDIHLHKISASMIEESKDLSDLVFGKKDYQPNKMFYTKIMGDRKSCDEAAKILQSKGIKYNYADLTEGISHHARDVAYALSLDSASEE